jgi:hypothetical protein
MKNIKITLTPAEAYIVHHCLKEGWNAVFDEMRLQEAQGSRAIITPEYVRQVVVPILEQLEQQ